MKITFISEIKQMTYQHYLAQPKQMTEWSLIKILNKNPMLLVDLLNLPLPHVNEIEERN